MPPTNAADYDRTGARIIIMVPHLVTKYDNTILLSLRNTRWLDGERREINKISSLCGSNLGSEAC